MEPTWRDRIRELALHWGPPLLALVFFRSAVASPFHVPTGSMVPSIEVGDHILVQKYAYGLNVPWFRLDQGVTLGALTTLEVVTWTNPARGDVVLFRYPPDPGIDYVKRVIGVPGDEIRVAHDRVFVNGDEMSLSEDGAYVFVDQDCQEWPGRRFQEDLGRVRHAILDSTRRMTPDFGPITVPEGALFVMGDNRDHSADSRMWGLVPRENVRGRAVSVWLRNACDESLRPDWRWL